MIDFLKLPSPCYVLDEELLDRNLATVDRVRRESGAEIIVALKACAMWSIFPELAKHSDGATASSAAEARLVFEEFGRPAHTYAPVYTDSNIDEILNCSDHITFNSLSQFRRFGQKALINGISCGLRINPQYSPVETDLYNPCVPGSRLGVTAEQLAAHGGLPVGVEGLHFHVLCESRPEHLQKALEAVETHFGAYLDRIKWLNMGGGHLMTASWYDCDRLIALLKAFRSRHPNLRLILEPGSAFTWRTGFLVSTVEDIVENGGVTTAMLEQMLKNAAAIADKPVIGISWSYNGQNYDSHKTIFKTVGAIPVELDQVTSTAVKYDAEGKIESAYLEESGMLKQEYADKVKEKDLTASNVGAVMQAIDGVFFTGGEDVSPSLFKVPEKEKNEGEEINATRDISDYMLMAYCLEKDVPTFAVCRGEQVMSIVSGCTFIQDIPNYYKEQGKTYNDTHRMPADAPNRTYARHDVVINKDASKWLYKIVGSTELKNVSSWHHQAVGGVEGTNLTVVSTATIDGVEIIEAVERQDKTFCLGVQFHPENDCKFVLYTKTPEKALCDYETCLNFFEMLVEYAGK